MLTNLIGLLVLLALAVFFAWAAVRASRSLRRLFKWPGMLLFGLLALVFGLAAAGIGRGLFTFYAPRRVAVPQIAVEGSAEQVARGEHLAGYVCIHCHSANEQLPLSGGLDVSARSPVPIGSLVPFNLTPGGPLKDWTDPEIFRAIRLGVDRNGRPLIAMSSLSVRFLSDADISAVIAYLRSQPAVENTIQGGDRPNLLFALFAGANLIPKPEPVTGVVASPVAGPTAEYGEYIVRYLGCQDCHGPGLAGGKSGGLTPVGPSLRAAATWSPEQFIQTIRTGITPSGHALDPEKMFWKDFGLMDDEELAAVHAYLYSLATAQAQGGSR